jgi:hypothetical protein
MIGARELYDAAFGHVERTNVTALAPLFDALGVDGDELRALIASLWEQREPAFDPAELATPASSLYAAAFVDGLIIGVRAARAEPGSPQ